MHKKLHLYLKPLSFLLLFFILIEPSYSQKKKNKKIKRVPKKIEKPFEFPKEAYGTVKEVVGDVTQIAILSKSKDSIKIQVNDTINYNTSYTTSARSQLVFELNDKTIIRLGAQSNLSFNKSERGYIFRLLTGSVLFESPKTENLLIVQTTDAQIETNECKMIVTYKPLFEQTALYVETGSANIQKIIRAEEKSTSSVIKIASMEFSEVTAQEASPKKAKPLSSKNLEMLKKLSSAETANSESDETKP